MIYFIYDPFVRLQVQGTAENKSITGSYWIPIAKSTDLLNS